MLTHRPPLSNVERQRRFRARHPGYRNRFRYKQTPQETRKYILAVKSAAEQTHTPSATANPEALALRAPVAPAAIEILAATLLAEASVAA